MTLAALTGVATGIGSLPHVDPARAVALVLEHQPELPAAPSLPRRSPHESMLGQGAWGAAGMTAGPDGTLFVDLDRLDPDAPLGDPGFDGDAFVTLRAFLAAVEGRTDPVKLQLTGPITLGLALHNAGAPADIAFRAAASAVAQRAALLRTIVASPAVVFLDEPGLTGAPHPGFPISLARAVELLARALAVVGEWAVPGVHCCGRADWRAVLDADPASCPSRSTRSARPTANRSRTSSARADGSRGVRSPPTDRWAPGSIGCAAGSWPRGSRSCRLAATPANWPAKR